MDIFSTAELDAIGRWARHFHAYHGDSHEHGVPIRGLAPADNVMDALILSLQQNEQRRTAFMELLAQRINEFSYEGDIKFVVTMLPPQAATHLGAPTGVAVLRIAPRKRAFTDIVWWDKVRLFLLVPGLPYFLFSLEDIRSAASA